MSSKRFEDFLQASRLTELDLQKFIDRSQRWQDPGETVSIFDQPGSDFDLPQVSDSLQELFSARRSVRQFNDEAISEHSLAAILGAVGSHLAQPVVPSAGGLDPIQTYALVRKGVEPYHGKVLRFIHNENRVAPVAEMPDTQRCRQLFSLDCEGTPALFLAFVVDPALTLQKYGERGGRFLLQQVGHATQNVGLRLAQTQLKAPLKNRRNHQKLHGYITGGVLEEVLAVIGLAHTRAVLICGYAIGAEP